MADLTHYDKSETFSVTATFTVAGTPTDPTTVAATAYLPDGTTIAYAYPSANISRTSAGIYVVTDTASQTGVWYVEVVGTGTAAGRERQTFVVDPRWPTDLLSTGALTTIEKVELLIDQVGTQGTRANEEDSKRWIATLINAFSTAIKNYTERQFKPTETATTKVFVGDQRGFINLAPFEASTITSVVLYTDRSIADQETLAVGYSYTTDFYYGEPRNRTPEGTYLRLALPTIYEDRIQVSVTGNWGAGTVPADVDYVCASECANAYWRSRMRTPAVTGLDDNYLGPDVGPFALSRRAQAMLEPYANRVFVG